MTNIAYKTHFWQWFAENNVRLLEIYQSVATEKEEVLDEILAELHKYCNEIYFEISDTNNETLDLVITAEGDPEYFQAVEELVEVAPEFPGWRVVAFRQPAEDEFVTVFEGREFDPEQIVFLPVYHDDFPEDIGLHVCYNDLKKANYEKLLSGTMVVVDSILGEKAAAEEIDYLDVIKTPENIEEFDYWVLADLDEYVEMRHEEIDQLE